VSGEVIQLRGPAKPRVPQAERSATMRARLSQAAFEVILEQGYVNFRTAAVARQAGVSQGAQLHHFPTKNSLALAASEYAFEQATAASAALIKALPPDGDPVDALLEDAKAYFLSPYFRVALDILMAGGSDPVLKTELTAITLSQRGKVERLWLERLIDDGWSLVAAEDVLAMTLCLVRGLSIRALVESVEASVERIFERWRAMTAALAKSGRKPT